jgi:hypothetical protein
MIKQKFSMLNNHTSSIPYKWSLVLLVVLILGPGMEIPIWRVCLVITMIALTAGVIYRPRV